jgi:DNA-nicking Smr family endonuclease
VKKKADISETDKKDWKEYLENPKDIFDKDLNSNRSLEEYSRFKFDLHGYQLLEANEKVREIIFSCSEKKYKEILLVTGKGMHSETSKDVYASKDLSKLRYSIPEYINSDHELSNKVSKIYTASLKDGGDGAIVIKLKKL